MKKYLIIGFIVLVSFVSQVPKVSADVVLPTIATGTITGDAVSVVTSTTAGVTAQILDDGGEGVHVTFDYGIDTSYGLNSDSGFSGVTSNNQVNHDITNLICSTTYHYRAVATNSAGTAYGEDMSFTTNACPTITITSPNGGETYSPGQTITVTWDSTGLAPEDNLALAFDFPTEWLPVGMGFTVTSPIPNTGSYEFVLPDISQFVPSGFFQNGNFYRIKLFVMDDTDVSDLSDSTFTVDNDSPIVYTDEAVSVNETSAILAGYFSGIDNVSSIGFRIWKESTPEDDFYSSQTLSGEYFSSGTHTLGTSLVLSCNTWYLYQFSVTSNGSNYYGDIKTFTTAVCSNNAPVVITNPATSIGTHWATLNGSFPYGTEGKNYTSGFDYGLTTEYGMTNQFPIPEVGGSNFSSATGVSLECSKTYHFRARVSDGVDTFYGEDLTFDTLQCQVLRTNEATDITQTTATISADLISTDGFVNQYGFEYGVTSAYGSTTEIGVLIDPRNPQSFSANLIGLLCGTTYHFKPQISFSEITAPYEVNISTIFGENVSFTTLPCSTGGGGGGGGGHHGLPACLMPDSDKNPDCNLQKKNDDIKIETKTETEQTDIVIKVAGVDAEKEEEAMQIGTFKQNVGGIETIEENNTTLPEIEEEKVNTVGANVISSGVLVVDNFWFWIILLIVIIAGVYAGYRKNKKNK